MQALLQRETLQKRGFLHVRVAAGLKREERIKKEIGKRIRFLRRKYGLSQKELAEMINRTKATVDSYESGRIFPHVMALRDIALALKCSTDFLLAMDIEKDRKKEK